MGLWGEAGTGEIFRVSDTREKDIFLPFSVMERKCMYEVLRCLLLSINKVKLLGCPGLRTQCLES